MHAALSLTLKKLLLQMYNRCRISLKLKTESCPSGESCMSLKAEGCSADASCVSLKPETAPQA